MRRKTHDTIRRVTADIDVRKQFNTAISAMMELVNDLYAYTKRQESEPSPQAAAVAREALEALIVMLSPFAPHTSEELWEQFGHSGTLSAATWPAFDAEAARAEEIVIPVQVNGKLRGRLTVVPDIAEEELVRLALADPAVKPYTEGKTVKKVVVAPARLVSIVVG
jgi:leucyl-tRNA synthetase